MRTNQSDFSDNCKRHGEWLTAHRAAVQSERDVCGRSEARWSWTRLVVFLAGAAPWFFWAATPLTPALISVAAAAAFYWTVKRHIQARELRDLHDGMLTVLDESLLRVGGKLEVIRSSERPDDDVNNHVELPNVLDAGSTWSLTDQERDDLDVFKTPAGLFGLLNRTSTPLGARRLRDMLNHVCLSEDRIRERQEAVRWLENHPEQRVRMTGAAVWLRKESKRLAGFVRAVDHTRGLKLFASIPALRIWSLITAVVAIASLANMFIGNYIWGAPLVIVLISNGLIMWRIGGLLEDLLAPWRDVAWGARGFHLATRENAEQLPDETLLAKLRGCHREVVEHGQLPRLCNRLGWMEHGGIIYGVLKYSALYDLHVAAAILHIVAPQREMLLRGLSALADLEAFASLACFASEQPTASYPSFSQNTELRIAGGRHPLIPPERVVPNDVRLSNQNRMWIVTGSNMAGKSTFLRMAGVNVLLAQIGSAVTAESMSWAPLRLMTDLQARDNLAEQESYFLAEVRHLRRMVLPPDGRNPLLCLIDEPFRGTNSQDQSAASVAVLKHLQGSNNLTLLATHDRSLTELADGGDARNFHFREDLDDSGMVFDYRLHEGPAKTRNALRVLEREGYPKQVVADANAWLGRAGD